MLEFPSSDDGEEEEMVDTESRTTKSSVCAKKPITKPLIQEVSSIEFDKAESAAASSQLGKRLHKDRLR